MPDIATFTDRVPRLKPAFVSGVGLFVGLIFFSLSLTPSLIPRQFVLQGILSGCVFAVGYGVGVFLDWIWTFIGFKRPQSPISRVVGIVLMLGAVIFAMIFLWHSTGWQNSIRAVMDMEPVESLQPLQVVLIAIIPAAVLIGIGTLIVHSVRFVGNALAKVVPRRAALLFGMLIVLTISNLTVNGFIARWLFQGADRFYANLDQLAGSYEARPVDPLRSGSEASLVTWDTIGRDARIYVQSGPTAAEIEATTGKPAIEPIRVYVGLRSAETAQDRAQLALAEMDRVGAFDRSILVLIMPVGTGWVEPAAIDTLEFLHGGDVASVAVQYSYLTSWLSLVAEPDVGVETAEALFDAVYLRWTKMPHDNRPKLYLHGLSLGAYSSQASTQLYDILADPFDGALWVGPPFASDAWRSFTSGREPGSPWWRPRIGDGSVVRFANQGQALDEGDAPWGPVRLIYLQYPSDPIVFFDRSLIYRRPQWLGAERAPDISPLLNWFPFVTFFQVALDMALSQTSPIGFGHVYAPEDYFDAWVSLTDPTWSEQELADLRTTLSREGMRTRINAGWFRG